MGRPLPRDCARKHLTGQRTPSGCGRGLGADTRRPSAHVYRVVQPLLLQLQRTLQLGHLRLQCEERRASDASTGLFYR